MSRTIPFLPFSMMVTLAMMLSGCVTAVRQPLTKKEIMKAYLSQVAKYDGIDREEALLLAQSQLIFRGIEGEYYIDKPQISESLSTWQVTFYPINRTLAEALEHTPVFVAVHKLDGSVKFLKG